jgi:hypothetical protein
MKVCITIYIIFTIHEMCADCRDGAGLPGYSFEKPLPAPDVVENGQSYPQRSRVRLVFVPGDGHIEGICLVTVIDGEERRFGAPDVVKQAFARVNGFRLLVDVA